MRFELFENLPEQEWLLEALPKIEWRAGTVLHEALVSGDFHPRFGYTSRLYFLLDDHKIVGFGTILEQDFHPVPSWRRWIAFIYVYPEYRGWRLSEKIVTFLEDEIRKLGETTVHILTQHQGLYEKFGYTFVREEDDGYHDHSYIYTKDLARYR